MATLATQTINRAGLGASFASASGGGDKFHPGSRVYLHVKNGDSSAHNVTIATPGTPDGLALADVVVSVPATSEREIGPLPRRLFADPADGGLGAITYAAVTSVTVAVKELSQ